MAEQTFRSPGFFEQEVDLTQRVQSPTGTPAGVVGTAQRGPAFVPVTVGSFVDFQTKFGNLDSKRFGPYAVNEFLKNRDAVTYVRVLGAGANDETEEINTTRVQGSVKNAGFKITPITTDKRLGLSTTHILAAKHHISASEQYGFPIFTHNDSYNSSADANLVRAVIFTTTDSRVGVLSASFDGTDMSAAFCKSGGDALATIGTSGDLKDKFKLFISSSDTSFATTDGQPGMRILTASLDPRNKNYIRNILNTDPAQFSTQKHLLYAAFDVEYCLASISSDANSVGMLSGSAVVSNDNAAGESFLTAFGRYDTRYNTPKTTDFISQPFGTTEYPLFSFETIDDGAFAAGKYKISIANIRGSLDENNPYGTFTVQVRAYSDNDKSKEVLEEYPQCDLNPNSEKFIGRMIGDKKAFFNFDAELESERKVTVSGKYPNMSNVVRVVLSDDVVNGNVPAEALPFGFKGIPALKTNDKLDDFTSQAEVGYRLGGRIGNAATALLQASILPPVPYTFKSTNGAVKDGSVFFVGQQGTQETVDNRIYWGAKTTMLAADKSVQSSGITNSALKSNAGTSVNLGLKDQAKFLGIVEI